MTKPNHWEVWVPVDDHEHVESLGDFSDRREALQRVQTALDDGHTSVTITVVGIAR